MAPAAAGATVTSWSTIGFTAVKQAIPVNNLIPGTTYIISNTAQPDADRAVLWPRSALGKEKEPQ